MGHQKHKLRTGIDLFGLEQIAEGETYTWHFQKGRYWADGKWEVEAEDCFDEDPPNRSSQNGIIPFSFWLALISPHPTSP
jgi:hypothetical protein